MCFAKIKPLALLNICNYKTNKKENIQIIHFHCLKSALLGFLLKFCKVTLVYTNHGLRYTHENNSYRRFFYLFLELCVAKFVNTYISIRESDDIRISKIFQIIKRREL